MAWALRNSRMNAARAVSGDMAALPVEGARCTAFGQYGVPHPMKATPAGADLPFYVPARSGARPPSPLGAQVDRGLELVSARLARPKMPHAALADVLGPFGSHERIAALRTRKQLRAVGFHGVRGVEHRYSSLGCCGPRRAAGNPRHGPGNRPARSRGVPLFAAPSRIRVSPETVAIVTSTANVAL